MGPNGEQARKFQETDEDHATCCLTWSPDGKQYLYISGESVVSRNVKGGLPVTLFQPSELAKMSDWVRLHDGRMIYALPEPTNDRTCNYWTTRIDPEHRQAARRTQEANELAQLLRVWR